MDNKTFNVGDNVIDEEDNEGVVISTNGGRIGIWVFHLPIVVRYEWGEIWDYPNDGKDANGHHITKIN